MEYVIGKREKADEGKLAGVMMRVIAFETVCAHAHPKQDAACWVVACSPLKLRGSNWVKG